MNEFTLSKAQEIVREAVESIPGQKKYLHSSIHVLCPFHDEKTPSCSVHTGSSDSFVPIGWFYCFGCGKTGPWNEFAEQTGLQKINKNDNVQENTRNIDLSRLRGDLLNEGKLTIDILTRILGARLAIDFALPSWRTISGKILQKVGAKLIVTERDQEQMVLLPVYVNKELVGGIKARMKKQKGETSYLNMAGEWAKTQGLFPFDYAISTAKRKRSKYLVLVEGPRDALRLIQCGIPAIAILGIEQWTAKKRNILLATGFDILVCMDGDKPGISASNIISSDLKNYLNVKVFRLRDYAIKLHKEKLDPCNMPISLVRKIRSICYN